MEGRILSDFVVIDFQLTSRTKQQFVRDIMWKNKSYDGLISVEFSLGSITGRCGSGKEPKFAHAGKLGEGFFYL